MTSGSRFFRKIISFEILNIMNLRKLIRVKFEDPNFWKITPVVIPVFIFKFVFQSNSRISIFWKIGSVNIPVADPSLNYKRFLIKKLPQKFLLSEKCLVQFESFLLWIFERRFPCSASFISRLSWVFWRTRAIFWEKEFKWLSFSIISTWNGFLKIELNLFFQIFFEYKCGFRDHHSTNILWINPMPVPISNIYTF